MRQTLRSPALFIQIALLLSLVVTPTLSSAITFRVTELSSTGDLAAPNPGDHFTIGIRILPDPEDLAYGLYGIAASLWGYDEAAVDFVSGQAVDSYLGSICVPEVGCFLGFDNQAAGALAESAIGANGNRVQIASSVAITPVNGGGPDDPGLDGVIGGGDAHFRATFVVTGIPYAAIEIGTGYPGDIVVVDGSTIRQANNARVLIDMSGIRAINVPEPGTALLLSLGLAALAARHSPGDRKAAA